MQLTRSMKMVWRCVAFGMAAVVLVLSGVGAGALFLLPCMLMMGAMMWMMMAAGAAPRRATPASSSSELA